MEQTPVPLSVQVMPIAGGEIISVNSATAPTAQAQKVANLWLLLCPLASCLAKLAHQRFTPVRSRQPASPIAGGGAQWLGMGLV